MASLETEAIVEMTGKLTEGAWGEERWWTWGPADHIQLGSLHLE